MIWQVVLYQMPHKPTAFHRNRPGQQEYRPQLLLKTRKTWSTLGIWDWTKTSGNGTSFNLPRFIFLDIRVTRMIDDRQAFQSCHVRPAERGISNCRSQSAPCSRKLNGWLDYRRYYDISDKRCLAFCFRETRNKYPKRWLIQSVVTQMLNENSCWHTMACYKWFRRYLQCIYTPI